MDLQICRICLNNAGTILLYEKLNDIQHSEKLMKCVNIIVSAGDGFPDTICDGCAQELAVAYDFVCKCENSDIALRSKEYVIYQRQIHEVSHLEIKEEVKLENNLLYDLKNFEVGIAEKISTEVTGENVEEQQVKAFYPCDTCGAMFLLKESLKKHNHTQHRTYKKGRKRRLVRPSQCGVCGLLIESRSAMARHIKTHSAEKPFSCNQCNNKFTVNSSLKRHIKAHQCGEKFICDICGTEFVSKTGIIEHIRNHDTDKHPRETYYSCDLCPKTYRQISSVLRHQLTHTGERRHSCPVCQKLFYRKYDVQRHIKSMHCDRQYSCHICNKIVKNENLLTAHLKKHANDKIGISKSM